MYYVILIINHCRCNSVIVFIGDPNNRMKIGTKITERAYHVRTNYSPYREFEEDIDMTT